MSEQKLLVIGLDGATWVWLTPFVEQGVMPCLSKLLSKSSWGTLESTVPPFTATAWSSFATGLNPGGHGILSFEKRSLYDYGRSYQGFVDADRLDITVWEVLSAAGKTVGVVNVPLSYPARPVNGYMVTGMMTPPGAARFTYPSTFAHKLQDYQIDVEFIRAEGDFNRHITLDKPAMLTEIGDVMRKRIKNCVHLMHTEPTDFFMVVFTCTDRISHFFWDELLDLIQGQAPTPLHEDVLALFHELDAGIQQLLDCVDENTAVMLMSDHGFGSSPHHRAHLNVWLEQQGWLQRRAREGLGDAEYWRVWLGRQAWLKKILRTLIPQKTQDSLSSASTKVSKEIVDWSQSQVYFMPIYFHICGLGINTSGRCREGIVPEGADYEALRDSVMAALGELVDPHTQRPLVRRMWRREELFNGEYVEQLPDIIVELDPDYVGAQSLAGDQIVEPHAPFRSGEHRPDGIFALAGPQVRPQVDMPDLQLQDLAATILYLMDVPVPESFDAQVQTQLFTAAHLNAHPVRYQKVAPIYVADEEEAPATAAEDELIEQRLRGLGYLE